MEFYLIDVKSTAKVNGTDVAFDYINTHLNRNAALKDAKRLLVNDDVLDVSVHRWILKEDGIQEHADGADGGVLFHYVNKNHREWK